MTDSMHARAPGSPASSIDADSPNGAKTHDTLLLSGCMIHSEISADGLDWMNRVLRCDDAVGEPPAAAFDNLHATLRVQTFDDVDICVKFVTGVIGLGPIAAMGMRELIVNAVEHGNLGITFDEKSTLLKTGTWQDEIEKRLSSEEFGDRVASVTLKRDGGTFEVDIVDQGAGFDWEKYVNKETAPTLHLHGRGMPLAIDCGFESVDYRGTGNAVMVRGWCGSVTVTD